MWTSVDFHTALVGLAGGRCVDISPSSLSLSKKTDLLVFTTRLTFPFTQTFMRNMPAGHRQWDLFHSMALLTLFSNLHCSLSALAAQLKCIFFCSWKWDDSNESTLDMKGSNDPPSQEGSSGQMITLCLTVTSIHINKSTGLCLFAVSVTCW